jgi:hypothetical protein
MADLRAWCLQKLQPDFDNDIDIELEESTPLPTPLPIHTICYVDVQRNQLFTEPQVLRRLFGEDDLVVHEYRHYKVWKVHVAAGVQYVTLQALEEGAE